jgi:hypothetical protein
MIWNHLESFSLTNYGSGTIAQTTVGFREYAQQKLLTPLQYGPVYYARAYVKSAPNSKYFSKNVGMYFSDVANESQFTNIGGMYTDADATTANGLLDASTPIGYINPQVNWTGGNITNTNSWVRMGGCFSIPAPPPGPSPKVVQYLTIGNFKPNSYEAAVLNPNCSNAPVINGYSGIKVHSYMQFDDVSVVQINDAGLDRTICLYSSVIIGPECNLVSDGFTYKWSPFTGLYKDAACTQPYTGTGNYPNLYAKPTTTTTYTLKTTPPTDITSCAPFFTDNVTISYLSNSELQFMFIQGVQVDCANPNGYFYTYTASMPSGINTTGNYSYAWSASPNGSIYFTSGTNSSVVDVHWYGAGTPTITCTITDLATGCQTTLSESISIPGCSPSNYYNAGNVIVLGDPALAICSGSTGNVLPTPIPTVSALVASCPTCFSGGYFIHSNVLVVGTFVINQNFKVLNSTFTMFDDARITDITGAPKDFTIVNSTFSGTCNVMWDGIYLNNTLSKILTTTSSFSDARSAFNILNGAKKILRQILLVTTISA